MAYIGRNLEQFSNVEKLDNITFTNSAGPYNLLKGAVAFVPANAQSLLIEVDGVIQSSDSYTVSVSTITFGVSMASTSTMNSIIHLGVGLISTPGDGTVNTVQLANDAVTTSKILDNNVTVAKLPTTLDISGNTVTLPASVSGLGTGITNAQLAGSIDVTSKLSGLVPVANLGTGTASATTYLAGNQTYQTITEYNDDKLVNDISTLALHQATNNNSAKYNLTNSNVDVYQDSTAIANLTNVARDATGEYVHTSGTSTSTEYDIIMSKTRADISRHTGTWTNALTNDSISRPSGSTGDYPTYYSDWIYDLASDWKIKVFIVARSNGSQAYENYQSWNTVVTTDTSVASGQDTAGATSDGRVFRAENLSSTSNQAFLLEPTEWKTKMFTTAYGNTIGTDGATDNYGSSAFGTQTINCASGSIHMQRAYAFAQNSYGWLVEYDRTANTITIQCPTNTAFTTFGSNKTIYTNVPETGRFLFTGGSGGASINNYYSTTYAGVTDANKGNAVTTVTTTPATGNYESTAQTANASVTTISGVVTYTNTTGTATLNTDIILEVSADNGSTWQSAALTAAGTFSTGVLQATTNDITVVAGTQIKYKMSFANQASATKVTRINGVSLSY